MDGRMLRHLPALVALAIALTCTGAALGDDIAQKQAVDAKISALQGSLASSKDKEDALRAEIDGVTARIRGLEAQVGDVSLRLQTLEQDLALHHSRLAKLNELFHVQSQRFALLKQ